MAKRKKKDADCELHLNTHLFIDTKHSESGYVLLLKNTFLCIKAI